MDNPTPPPDAQAMTREQIEEIIDGGDAETFLRHYGIQAETIRRLEQQAEMLKGCLEENRKHADQLQARLTASEAKRKWTSQPTSEGWYFWRRIVRQKEVQTVVRVKKNWGNAKLYIQACRYVEDCHGEFQGPLTPGEE